jgi:ubiquitin carboxyl-terminal hydrolase 5/13
VLPANFQLQSIVCHKGSSIHAGWVPPSPKISYSVQGANWGYRHYVAFIRKIVQDEERPSWVLFNDEKVAKAADIDEMKKFAYVYFFRRL